MWRLTMSDGSALLSPELDAQGRAAAIAAMAARLAAARPRLHRRLAEADAAPKPQHAEPTQPHEEAPPACDLPKLDFPRERLATVSAPPAAPWRQHLGTMRNVAVLAVMAGCGVGVVVLSQSSSVATLFNGHGQAQSTAAAAPPATAPTSEPAAPHRSGRKVQQAESAPRPGAARKAAHDRLMAKTFAEPAHATPHHAAVRTAALTVPHGARGEPAPTRADDAAYALPRWVTDQTPPTAPSAPPEAAQQHVILSPPPHDLALPQPAPPAPAASASSPRKQPPEMIFASAGSPPSPSPEWKLTRPPFSPPYGPSYSTDGPYGFGYTPP
jgi:hypothetical protein